MDFSALEAFVTVAEQGSFSRAAEALHLTQPAISKRVAALESELDARLFDRIGRKVNLTEAGDALLSNARRILQELEESRRVIANLSTEVRGRLSLATSHHAGLHRLPPVLRIYTKQYPQVELDLHFMDSESACSAVEHGDDDALTRRHLVGLRRLELRAGPIRHEHEVLVHDGHRGRIAGGALGSPAGVVLGDFARVVLP